jgi:hypothetical protein
MSSVPFYETVMGFKVIRRAEAQVCCVARGSKSPWLKTAATRLRRVVFFQVDNAEAAFAALTANGLGRDHANFEVTAYGDDAFKQFSWLRPTASVTASGRK